MDPPCEAVVGLASATVAGSAVLSVREFPLTFDFGSLLVFPGPRIVHGGKGRIRPERRIYAATGNEPTHMELVALRTLDRFGVISVNQFLKSVPATRTFVIE